MALGITAVIERPGGESLELTPLEESLSWSTAAVGGFGGCSFTLPGPPQSITKVPFLARVRLFYGTEIVYEGRIEDRSVSLSDGQLALTIQCFGYSRLLDDVSVRRIWSKRDIDWEDLPEGPGADVSGGSGLLKRPQMEVAIGRFDVTDPTLVGVQVSGVGNPTVAGCANGATYPAPAGLLLSRLLGTVTLAGANTGVGKMVGYVWYSATGIGAWTLQPYTATQAFSLSMTAAQLRVGAFDSSGGALTPTYADTVRFTDMRVLATSLLEDASGGFYGSTILRDLLTLVPGLAEGIIESGSDFTIQAIERAVRSAASDVVQEIAGYYQREWAVWEDGRFDWKTVTPDDPQWYLTTADCLRLDIDGSLEGLSKAVAIIYTDAASGIAVEAVGAAATSQRNPFVRTGTTKDELVQVGFPMTANTASQLAARVTADHGAYPKASGTLVLAADTKIRHASGQQKPAFLLRAGQNITITDLPKDEMFQGRDGQTHFHITGTEVDGSTGRITLELDSQYRSTDILLARLAAVTRVLTG